MTTASRATSLVGNATIDAAAQAGAKTWSSTALAELVGRQYEGNWVVDWTTKPGKASRHASSPTTPTAMPPSW